MPASARALRKQAIEVPTKGGATAERILDAAFKSIALRGCGAVTLRSIAEEAGVVLSQLNYYYGNKDNLFAAVLKRMQDEYIKSLDARLSQCTSLEEQIVQLVEYNEYILLKNSDTYRNFLEFFNFSMSSPEFRVQVSAFTRDIANIIERRMTGFEPKSGSQKQFRTASITRFILSSSFGIALQYFLDASDESVRDEFSVIKATAKSLATGI